MFVIICRHITDHFENYYLNLPGGGRGKVLHYGPNHFQAKLKVFLAGYFRIYKENAEAAEKQKRPLLNNTPSEDMVVSNNGATGNNSASGDQASCLPGLLQIHSVQNNPMIIHCFLIFQ